jgi:signal transduction histidine kinase
VERIAHNLRPSILDELGLVAVVRDTCTEFAERTGVAVKLAQVELGARLPADIELALYRILQEALKNVELHARARRVKVQLQQSNGAVRLTIKDDGTGVDAELPSARSKVQIGLNLLGIRERAAYVGGVLKVKSSRRAGMEIEVCIPRPTAN